MKLIARRWVLAIALSLLLGGAAPASAGPTQLWYRITIHYLADMRRHVLYNVPPASQAPGLASGTADVKTGEAVSWTASTAGSVLVRALPHGHFLVLQGVLHGRIATAENITTTTDVFRCWGGIFKCIPGGPPEQGDCYLESHLSLHTHGPQWDFTDPYFTMFADGRRGDEGLWQVLPGKPLLDPGVRGLLHTTGNLASCELLGSNPYPPDQILPYQSPLPIAPDWGGATALQFFHDEPVPTFAARGPDRFGGKHVVLKSGGGVNDKTPTGQSYPQPSEIDIRGSEDWVFHFDRCPGTAPC
jgi:hypothetical protein